ncbi:MAG: diacylglycerol kinase [Puniceicoccales bacterium]|nr:diacylglycerol kinase [Puniceicoccales bacterium]
MKRNKKILFLLIKLRRYIINPLSYSLSGMNFMRHERPFQTEFLCGVVIWPICFLIFGWGWKLLILTVDFFVLLLAECLNTAIEAAVDLMIDKKRHRLAKKAKDTASAAVHIALWNIIISALFILTFK